MVSKGEMVWVPAAAVALVAAAASGLKIAALDQATIATTIMVSATAAPIIFVISKSPFSDKISEGRTGGPLTAGLIRLKATSSDRKARDQESIGGADLATRRIQNLPKDFLKLAKSAQTT